jgi:hypothetical protein
VLNPRHVNRVPRFQVLTMVGCCGQVLLLAVHNLTGVHSFVGGVTLWQGTSVSRHTKASQGCPCDK